MPHARLQVIAGGEHSMHESTHADEVATAIESFIAQLA
jgi:alpha-beta hydrolase superfamily lysophospholipase